ncbi:UNVERIFIED_CONTAM: hypothetical protein HHA_265100 [Hammondia hammondi]|eukprot:XP_008887213.1 hypothetical protein HHA_265100 [Hammondia hammondi]
MNAPGTFVLAGNRSHTASANEQAAQKKQYGEFLRQQIAAEKQREFLSKMQRQSPLPGPFVSSSHDAYDMGVGLDRTRALSYASVLPMPARASDNSPHIDPQLQFAGEPSSAGWNTGTVQNLQMVNSNSNGVPRSEYPVAPASYSARGSNQTGVPYFYGAFPNGLGALYAPNSLLPQSTSALRSHPVYSQALYPTTTSHSKEVQSCGGIQEPTASSQMLATNTRRDRIEAEERNRAVAMPTTSLDSGNARPGLVNGDSSESPSSTVECCSRSKGSCPSLDTDGSHSHNKVQDKPVTFEEQKLREKRDYGEFLKGQIALRKQRERTERALSLGTSDLPGSKQRGYAPSVSMECGAHQSGQEREDSREPSSSLRRFSFGLGQGGNAADNLRWGTHEENVTARLKQQREYGEFLKRQAELKRLERDKQKEQELAEDKKLLEIAQRMELTNSASNYPAETRRRGRNRINLQAFEGLNVTFGGCKVASAEDAQNDLGSIYSEKTGGPPDRKPDGADFSNGERNNSTDVQSHHLETTITAKNDHMNETRQDRGRVPKTMFTTGSMNGGRAEGAWDDHEIRQYQKLSSKKLYQQALEEQIREKEARKEKEKQERLKEQAEERRLLDEAFQQEKRIMRLGRRPAKSFEEDVAAFRAPFHLKASDASPIKAGDGGQSSSSAGTTVAVTPPPQASQPYCRRDTGVANSDEQNSCLNREPLTVEGKDVVAYWKPANEDKSFVVACRGDSVPHDCRYNSQTACCCQSPVRHSCGKWACGGSRCRRQKECYACNAEAKTENSALDIVGCNLEAVRKEITRQQDELRSMQLQQQLVQLQQRLQHDELNRAFFGLLGKDRVAVPSSQDAHLPSELAPLADLLSLHSTGQQVPESVEKNPEAFAQKHLQLTQSVRVPSSDSSENNQDATEGAAASAPSHVLLGNSVLRLLAPVLVQLLEEQKQRTCEETKDRSDRLTEERGDSESGQKLDHGGRTSRGRKSRCPSRETERCSCHTQGSHDHGVNLEKLPQAIRCRFLAIRNLDNLAAPTFSLEESSCTSPASDHDTVVEPASPPVPAPCSPAFLGGVPKKPPQRLWRKAFSLSMTSLSMRLGLAARGPSVERREVTDHFKRRETNGRKAEQEVSSSPGKAFLDFLRRRGAQVERLRRTGEPLTLADRFRGRLTWEEDVMLAVRADDGPLDTVTQVLANIPEEERETKQTRTSTKPKRWSILRSAVKLGRRISRKRISFAPETKPSLESSDETSGMGKDATEKKRGRETAKGRACNR